MSPPFVMFRRFCLLTTAFLRGLGLGASLIVAIGAQNAFVLRQGLKREGRLSVALTCTLCDAALIALGVGGFGSVLAHHVAWARLMAWAGAAFLFVYGARAFQSALHPSALTDDAPPAAPGATVVTVLALSLLNPHVYLDTVVLLGGLSAQYAPRSRLEFGLGAVSASVLWFFGLAYGAGYLAPLFQKPSAWRFLDGLIGTVMWALALGLILGTPGF